MAKYLGRYSGILYEEEELESIDECVTLLNWMEPILDDEPAVVLKREVAKGLCELCAPPYCPVRRSIEGLTGYEGELK